MPASRHFRNSTYGLVNSDKYDARVRLIATGGTVSTSGSSISVTNANDVVLLLEWRPMLRVTMT